MHIAVGVGALPGERLDRALFSWSGDHRAARRWISARTLAMAFYAWRWRPAPDASAGFAESQSPPSRSLRELLTTRAICRLIAWCRREQYAEAILRSWLMKKSTHNHPRCQHQKQFTRRSLKEGCRACTVVVSGGAEARRVVLLRPARHRVWLAWALEAPAQLVC